MEDNKVFDLVTALQNSDKAGASDIFANIMSDKINDALDARKVDIAQHMFSDHVEQESEEDEDIQAVSGSESE